MQLIVVSDDDGDSPVEGGGGSLDWRRVGGGSGTRGDDDESARHGGCGGVPDVGAPRRGDEKLEGRTRTASVRFGSEETPLAQLSAEAAEATTAKAEGEDPAARCDEGDDDDEEEEEEDDEEEEEGLPPLLTTTRETSFATFERSRLMR